MVDLLINWTDKHVICAHSSHLANVRSIEYTMHVIYTIVRFTYTYMVCDFHFEGNVRGMKLQVV